MVKSFSAYAVDTPRDINTGNITLFKSKFIYVGDRIIITSNSYFGKYGNISPCS